MPENTPENLRATVLHSRHVALGATMAPFGGWEMPLWYKAGAVNEHLAVVRAAGLFDTSHMDVLFVEGDNVRRFLNFACTKDISALPPGRAAYGAFLNAQGHCIDDAIVYPLLDGKHIDAYYSYALVVNAGMGPVICDHLASLPGADRVDVKESDVRLAKLDLQGPASVAVLAEILEDADNVFASFPFFSFKGDVCLKDGTPILLSRTGYTGELGFEMFLPLDRAGEVWDDLLRAGESRGLLPCGLAARDSLRAGAVLPLSHQDIGGWPFINHPWEFALPLAEGGFTKDFVGRGALGQDAPDRSAAPHTLPFAGFDPRRVDAHSATVVHDGRECGTVLTIVTDMAIGRVDGAIVGLSSPTRPDGWTPRGLACGFVKIDRHLDAGTEVSLKDGKREIKVEIVKDIRPNRTARRKLT